MEAFQTEEQQVEAIRAWLRKNGMSLVAGAVLGLAALGGWKYYQQWQSDRAVAASDAWQAVAKLSEDVAKKDEFRKAAEALVADHKGSSYAQFGQLMLAKLAVEASDLTAAATHLKAVAAAPADEAIGHVATLRLARVQIAQGEAEAALKLLQVDKDKAGGFLGAYHRVRGDALVKLGRNDEAHAAFQAAKDAGDSGARHPVLALELDATQPADLATGISASGTAQQ